MAMTKKQAAQRILDSFETESRRKNRTIFSFVPALATSAVIANYSYQVAIGCILLFLALIQFGYERMGKSIEESKVASIASLGWKIEDLDDDNLVEKLNKIILK